LTEKNKLLQKKPIAVPETRQNCALYHWKHFKFKLVINFN